MCFWNNPNYSQKIEKPNSLKVFESMKIQMTYTGLPKQSLLMLRQTTILSTWSYSLLCPNYFYWLRFPLYSYLCGETFWGISCEKSRFYTKKHIFFNFRGWGGGALGASPFGSAPVAVIACIIRLRTNSTIHTKI